MTRFLSTVLGAQLSSGRKLFRGPIRSLVVALGFGLAMHAVAAQVPPTIRVLPRTRPDRLYQLQITLPASFAKNPDKKYPMVLVTDGYWQFAAVTSIYWGLVYGKSVPEMLVLGLGYAGKNLDYGQMRIDDFSPMGEIGHGAHAEEFLDLIERDLLPLLETEYRADPHHRYLLGSSAGGLFTMYAALTRPALFQGYVADSPSVAAGFPYERTFAKAGRRIPGRVFISAAENEWPAYRDLIGSFCRLLEHDGIVRGGMRVYRAEHMRHAGSTAETYAQGLLYVTEPIAPETGPQLDGMYGVQGKPLFGVFFTAKQPTIDPNAQKAHEVWLSQLVTQRQVLIAGATPAGARQAFSGFLIFSADRSAVEALAKTSPAFQAGLVDFEIFASDER